VQRLLVVVEFQQLEELLALVLLVGLFLQLWLIKFCILLFYKALIEKQQKLLI